MVAIIEETYMQHMLLDTLAKLGFGGVRSNQRVNQFNRRFGLFFFG